MVKMGFRRCGATSLMSTGVSVVNEYVTHSSSSSTHTQFVRAWSHAVSSLDAPNDGFVRGRIPPPGFGRRGKSHSISWYFGGRRVRVRRNLTPSAGISEVKMEFPKVRGDIVDVDWREQS